VDYGVLREIADHAASHHGIDQAYAYPGVELLAKESRWSKSTVLDAIRNLEDTGYLLVRRPSDRGTGRGTGRHSEYVVLMGRHPRTVAEKLGWTVPERSATHTGNTSSGEDARSGDERDDDAKDGAPTSYGAPGRAQTAPSVTCGQQPTTPVYGLFRAPDERSATHTGSTSIGVRSVVERSSNGVSHGTETEPELEPSPLVVDLAHGTDRDRARGAVRHADDLVDVLTDVRRHVASLVPGTDDVRWDLTARQLRELLVHSLAWPSRDAVAVAWSTTAAAAVIEYQVPRSARAWVAPWLMTDPPAVLPGEAMCDEHALGALLVPTRVCAMCRVAVLTS
jgi:hypothetical protein